MGFKNAKRETAKELILMGLEDSSIVKATKLTLEEVQEIRKNLEVVAR